MVEPGKYLADEQALRQYKSRENHGRIQLLNWICSHRRCTGCWNWALRGRRAGAGGLGGMEWGEEDGGEGEGGDGQWRDLEENTGVQIATQTEEKMSVQ